MRTSNNKKIINSPFPNPSKALTVLILRCFFHLVQTEHRSEWNLGLQWKRWVSCFLLRFPSRTVRPSQYSLYLAYFLSFSWLGQINSTLLIILVSQKKIRDLFTEQKEVKIETGMGKEVCAFKLFYLLSCVGSPNICCWVRPVNCIW